MENARYEENDEIEINLVELFSELKKRIWLIILAAVIGGGAFGAYSKMVLVPQYTSTAMMYVLSKETTLTSLADLQIGSQLTKDYKVMINSRPVLNRVIEDLGLDYGYKTLRNKLTIDNPTDTRILTLSVEDSDPIMAADIVNTIAKRSSEYIGEMMEMVPPKIVEEGEASEIPASPNTKKNALIGAAAGAFLVCAFAVLRLVMNDTVKTEEDIERYLKMSVLAAIPTKGKGKRGQR